MVNVLHFSYFYPLHLLFIGVYCNKFGHNSPESEFKCLDGQLPLLDENRSLFSCQRRCPDTFLCENQPTISLCCPNATAIAAALNTVKEGNLNSTLLRDKKEIDFQLESSAELLKTMSCERFPYKATCASQNHTDSPSQPLAKWYFDIQTLSCEMYPLGMCEEDPLEGLALRTRVECEDRCDVMKVKSALEKLAEGSNSISKGQEVFHFNRFPHAPIDQQIAIDDVAQESKHIRGRPFAIEPPTDLVHVIHVPSDAHVFRMKQQNQKDIEDNQLLTGDYSNFSEEVTESSEAFPTVTSDILTVLEDINDDGNVMEGSGSEGSITVTVRSRERSDELLEKVQAEERVLQEEKQRRTKSLQSLEDSFELFYQRNRELTICTQSSYKLLCASGKPSQFVYRWEKVDGRCQSFPYSYCWKELNVAHPRTKAECEQFCV